MRSGGVAVVARERAVRAEMAAAAAAVCAVEANSDARAALPAAAPAICPVREKASNRIGAAAMRPIRPGTGAPSGRPTQTPMVRLPSKPTDQASR